MEKYKLIKKYPSLPNDWEEGMLLHPPTLNYLSEPVDDKYSKYAIHINEVVNSPEFWEKVVEKDYEILSFIRHNKTLSNAAGCIKFKNSDGYFVWDLTSSRAEENDLLNNGGFDIHSIKRLSDGEIFTVGDRIKQSNVIHNNTFTITGFKLDVNNKHLLAIGNGGIKISKIEKVKNVLFTTEDGVDIFEGDVYYMFNNILWNQPSKTICRERTKISTYYTAFSTKEAAEEYLLMNKPCLSFKEISPIFGQFHMDNSKDSLDRLTEKLKKIINEKI